MREHEGDEANGAAHRELGGDPRRIGPVVLELEARIEALEAKLERVLVGTFAPWPSAPARPIVGNPRRFCMSRNRPTQLSGCDCPACVVADEADAPPKPMGGE